MVKKSRMEGNGVRERGREKERCGREGGRERYSHFDGNILLANISKRVETGPVQKDMHNYNNSDSTLHDSTSFPRPIPILQYFISIER